MKLDWEKMAKLLELKGISAYRVAKDLKLSQSLFARWREGTGYPKHEKVSLIAEYFDVPVSYFYGDDENEQYYTNLATNYLAQKLRDDQKALMRSAVNLTPEEVKAVDMFIKALKGEA